MPYFGINQTEDTLRALGAHVAGATENTDWIDVGDADELNVGIRITAGAGFSLDAILQTTDDEDSGATYEVGPIGGSPFTTTGTKAIGSFGRGSFKRFVRVSGVEGNTAALTWEAKMTRTVRPGR